MIPSPAELEYFLKTAQCLNFSRAALKLGIAQPSLSMAMKRLEETMGVPLFIRHKQGVTLTQAGKQLYGYARKLVDDWENVKNKAVASHECIQGRFTIGCNSAIAIYLASSFLPDLLRKHPQLEIHFQHDLSQYITQEVIQLNIDVGIVINPIEHPDLVIRKLGSDVTGFWASGTSRSIQHILSAQPPLICNENSIQAQHLLKKLRKKHIQFNRIIHTNSLEVVAHLTANECGIGILPERVAQLLYPKQLKTVSGLPVHSDELCLISRNENRDVNAIQAICSAIKRSIL